MVKLNEQKAITPFEFEREKINMDMKKIWDEGDWTKQARDIIGNLEKFPANSNIILILRYFQRNEPDDDQDFLICYTCFFRRWHHRGGRERGDRINSKFLLNFHENQTLNLPFQPNFKGNWENYQNLGNMNQIVLKRYIIYTGKNIIIFEKYCILVHKDTKTVIFMSTILIDKRHLKLLDKLISHLTLREKK